MELIVRVAETGSMTLAARQLQLTPAAVSAAVQRTEDALGVRLFERTTRSLHPTDEGDVIIAGCQDVVRRWQRTLDEATGHGRELEGTVNLSAPADTTYQILESTVAKLCLEHPKLRVVLDTSDAIARLHRDAIDMAVRYGTPPDSTLTARKLVDAPALLVASPGYVREHGTPKTPEALSEHRCVTLRRAGLPVVVWHLRHGDATVEVELDSPLCGNGFLARRWAVAGMGIAFKSLFDVIDDLESGRLVRVLPDFQGERAGIHVVFPSRRFLPARVRTLDRAIAAEFAERAERCRAWWARH